MKIATPADHGFWDSSALTLLCVHQPDTAVARRLHAQAPNIIVWWGTRVEVRSAIRRASAVANAAEIRAALRRLDHLIAIAAEVEPSEAIRDAAADVVDRYDLRAADALQLAAALIFCNHFPRGRRFVCFDKRLSVAAEAAGFTVLPPL